MSKTARMERILSTDERYAGRLYQQLYDVEREVEWTRQHEEKPGIMTLVRQMRINELKASIAAWQGFLNSEQ